MNNIMLDLETMGNNSNSPLIAIGAVYFDQNGLGGEFYTQVQLESHVKLGAEIDSSTVLWWLKQSDQARSAFKGNESADPLWVALGKFSQFVGTNGSKVKVWGNGAAFDNVILGNAYRLSNLEQPWKFWNDMCYRTIKNIYSDVEMQRVGTHHNALDDAKSQAVHLIQIAEKHGVTL